jgi:hypothetical protein
MPSTIAAEPLADAAFSAPLIAGEQDPALERPGFAGSRFAG